MIGLAAGIGLGVIGGIIRRADNSLGLIRVKLKSVILGVYHKEFSTMSELDIAIFLVAGATGAFWRNQVAWFIIGGWALLKLLHVL